MRTAEHIVAAARHGEELQETETFPRSRLSQLVARVSTQTALVLQEASGVSVHLNETAGLVAMEGSSIGRGIC